MKNISRLLARLFFDRSPIPGGCSNVRHVVVIRWDAKLGDSIVSSFFFREIKKLGGTTVTVLTVGELAAMHQNDFGADQVIVTSKCPGIPEMLKIWRKIGRVDVVVHLVGRIQPREIFFLWLIRASQVYSLDDALHAVNRKMGNSTRGRLFAEKYAWVLERLGVEVIQRDYIVPLAPPAAQRGRIPENIDILFNPYASRDGKSLSPEKSGELLLCLADAFPNCSIGILSSRQTCPQAKLLEQNTKRDNIIALEDIVTPQNVVEAIQRARIVVSVDTATVHIAVGLRKRLVAIYPAIGADNNPWLPPKSATTHVIYSIQGINYRERCGSKDMSNFNASDVVSAVGNLFARNKPTVVTIKAKLISGMGAANRNLARQLPLISEKFPEISNCWPGTINLELETPLTVINPSHRTPPLAWTPSGVKTEVFDLVRIELKFSHMDSPVPAWLYVAHASPHRKTPTVHEVIAQKLNISGITTCYMCIPTASAVLGTKALSLYDYTIGLSSPPESSQDQIRVL